MHSTRLTAYITAVLLGVTLLAPMLGAAKPPKYDQAPASAELTRILGDLEDVVKQLQMQDNMSAEEVSSLRRELTVIYRDLTALETRLERDMPPGDGPVQPAPHTWQRYTNAEQDVWPNRAKFDGWSRSADVSFEFESRRYDSDEDDGSRHGNYGVVVVSIDNADYQVRWTIRDAYRGQVEASINPERDGDVILTINDDDGQHEFLMKDGGLGELMLRGREDYRGPATKSAN